VVYAWVTEGMAPDDQAKVDEELYAPLEGARSLWSVIMRSEDEGGEGA